MVLGVQQLLKCNDQEIFLLNIRLFWSDRKIDKARGWFTRTAKIGPDLGDGWAYFYKFETLHGTEVQYQYSVEVLVNERSLTKHV